MNSCLSIDVSVTHVELDVHDGQIRVVGDGQVHCARHLRWWRQIRHHLTFALVQVVRESPLLLHGH